MQIKQNRQQSQLKNAAPPGAKKTAPEPKQQVNDAVEVRFDESEPDQGLTLWQKFAAGTMAGIAGFTALAPQAQAAPMNKLVTSSISKRDGLEVTVLPRGTARVDILRQKRQQGNNGNQNRDVPYSDVGVHIGRGVFHDTNGNLVLVPTLAAGWDGPISDFERVEMSIPGYDENVTRFGDTVHHKDGRYSRNVFVEMADGDMEVHRKGKEKSYEVLRNGVQYRGRRGIEWRVTQKGNKLNVDGPGKNDFTLTYGSNGIDLVGRRSSNTIRTTRGQIQVRGTGPDTTVTRGAGSVTKVETSGPFNDFTIVQQGNVTRVQGPLNKSSFTVNPGTFIRRQSLNYNELVRMIEEAEPGYAKKHPLVMGLLEYATANPGLVGEDSAGNEIFLDVGRGIATGGGALQSGIALLKGGKALALADNARALGASAMAAQAAAQNAAAAGNLGQAAALGNQARNLGAQAQALGTEAKNLGNAAAKTQQVAKVMTGVAGALTIADGVGDLHRGASSKDIVQGAIVMTEALRERLGEELSGRKHEQMVEDYSKVMQILNGLKKNANKRITIGGIKVGCGGLMLISALAGGAVIPPIIGAVGMVCTAGTSIYENWDQIEAFFTGTEVRPDPTLRNVLPHQLQEKDLFKID